MATAHLPSQESSLAFRAIMARAQTDAAYRSRRIGDSTGDGLI